MLLPLLTFAVFTTSILSGLLGMAGGMVLMGIFVLSIGVAQAMILHGVAQLTANGSRAWFLREHVTVNLLPPYLVGTALALVLFVTLTLVPSAAVVLILVGLFPWAARFTQPWLKLDITHKPTNVACGFVVTSAQLLAGASGPVLDAFYVNSPLSRQQIVAAKALTQTIGHLTKIGYYGLVVTVSTALEWWWFALVVIAAIAGTRVGTLLLDRWDDASFRRYTQTIILAIATLCIGQGLWLLVQP